MVNKRRGFKPVIARPSPYGDEDTLGLDPAKVKR